MSRDRHTGGTRRPPRRTPAAVPLRFGPAASLPGAPDTLRPCDLCRRSLRPDPFFSWRTQARHRAGSVLAAEGRLRLFDRSLRASTRQGLALGMRLFEAGPFQAGFGIVGARRLCDRTPRPARHFPDCRNSLGVRPVCLRNAVARWLWLENPVSSAIDAIVRSVEPSIVLARSKRRDSTY